MPFDPAISFLIICLEKALWMCAKMRLKVVHSSMAKNSEKLKAILKVHIRE